MGEDFLDNLVMETKDTMKSTIRDREEEINEIMGPGPGKQLSFSTLHGPQNHFFRVFIFGI